MQLCKRAGQEGASRHLQAAPEGFGHPANRDEIGVAPFGQGFVQAGPAYPRGLGHFGHSLGASGNAERVDKVGLVAAGQGFLQKEADILGVAQVFGDVEGFGLDGHGLGLQCQQKFGCFVDVFGLVQFVARSQQLSVLCNS